MRTFAMTGIVTASMMDLIICGSLLCGPRQMNCISERREAYHPRDATFSTDVGGYALKGHDGAGASFLGDARLIRAQNEVRWDHTNALTCSAFSEGADQ